MALGNYTAVVYVDTGNIYTRLRRYYTVVYTLDYVDTIL